MSTDIDCIVVGAGAVGLAIARALAQSGREVMVVEAAEGIGTGTSARTAGCTKSSVLPQPVSLMSEPSGACA